jgi:hypothetical protein
MNAFLWTMVSVFAISIFGKACVLYTQTKTRSLGATMLDLLIEVGLLAWAVSLLP